MEDTVPEHIVLGDVVKLLVETEATSYGFRAWAPQWPGVDGFGPTATGAVHRLQSQFEALMAQGIAPTLPVSP